MTRPPGITVYRLSDGDIIDSFSLPSTCPAELPATHQVGVPTAGPVLVATNAEWAIVPYFCFASDPHSHSEVRRCAIWDLRSRQRAYLIEKDSCIPLDIAQDGVALMRVDDGVVRWDPRSGQALPWALSLQMVEGTVVPNSTLSPFEERVFIGPNVMGWAGVDSYAPAGTRFFLRHSVSADGSRYFENADNLQPRVRDAVTGREISRLVLPPRMATLPRVAAAFSRDNGSLAAGFADGSIIVWQTNTGAVIRESHVAPDSLRHIAWSPSGTRLLTRTTLFEIPSGRALRNASEEVVWTGEFLPDSQRYVESRQWGCGGK